MKASRKMAVEVVSPADDTSLTEFILFRDRVQKDAGSPARSSLGAVLSFLRHASPFAQERELHILIVRENHEIVARAVAVVDERYNRHWGERLGHIIMYEAMRTARGATSLLMDKAREWLRNRGLIAARTGFGPFETGYALDGLPSYHAMLKDAGFETERGAAEYDIAVSRELGDLYEGFRRRAAAYEILPLREIPGTARVQDAAAVWNESYASHWGLAPLTSAEFAAMFEHAGASSLLELSAIAYRSGIPVGIILANQKGGVTSYSRWTQWKYRATQAGPANTFSVGVAPGHRGVGLALALASHAFLRLMALGAKRLNYGLVLDDNSPSRRVAAKLGASVCSNYLTYRTVL